MIDLHMHTTHSDGSLTTSELLQSAEKQGLTVISITDHNSVDAYSDLAYTATRNIFSGKIVSGIEINAIFEGSLIELLGYGIDVAKMKRLMENYPPYAFDEFFTEKVVEKLLSLGLKVNVEPMHAMKLFRHLSETYKTFFDKIDPKFVQNPMQLFREGFTKKGSPLCINFDGFFKSYLDVINIIRECGGLIFLAHPAEYRENSGKVLDELKNFVDGIECFHPSADKAFTDKLVHFAKENNLLISGGSDFHGQIKPNVELGGIGAPRKLVNWIE